jgi:hypothetical protein
MTNVDAKCKIWVSFDFIALKDRKYKTELCKSIPVSANSNLPCPAFHNMSHLLGNMTHLLNVCLCNLASNY